MKHNKKNKVDVNAIETQPASVRDLSEHQRLIIECMVEDGWDRDEAIEFLLKDED